jgi:hypothetical protein
MEERYPAAVMVTLSDCTQGEEEYNTWQDEVFVPAVEAVDFVTHVQRYENAYRDETTYRARPRYLTIAEVEHEDVEEAGKQLRALYNDLRAGRDASELRRLDTLYSRIGPEFRSPRTGRPVQFVYFGLVGCTDTTREDEWNTWYDDKHSPDALLDAFDTGYRYRVVNPVDPGPHQSSRYLSVYEISHDLGHLQKLLADFRQEMIDTDPLWVNLLSVVYSGLFTPMPR